MGMPAVDSQAGILRITTVLQYCTRNSSDLPVDKEIVRALGLRISRVSRNTEADPIPSKHMAFCSVFRLRKEVLVGLTYNIPEYPRP